MPRCLRPLAVPLLAALVAACGGAEHAGLEGAARRGLEDGRAAYAAWVRAAQELEEAAEVGPGDGTAPPAAAGGGAEDDLAPAAVNDMAPAAVDTATLVALGYLERHRLGLGGPFRLTELALTDPRLSPDTREDLAWALLAATVDRRGYEVDPAALDRVGAPGLAAWPGLGRRHLELMDAVVRRADDPRAGELALRLAYTLAHAEGRYPDRAPRLTAQAAGLLRDRELARTDAVRLLQEAARSGQDPLGLLPRWRTEGRFQVEAPLAAAASLAAEREALALLPDVRDHLLELGREAEELARHRPEHAEVGRSLLTPVAAEGLAALAAAWHPPPVTQVAVPLRALRREIVNFPNLSPEEAARRTTWVTEGVSEERFVAERARLTQGSPFDAGPSLAVLGAAVALRVHAQEAPWHPGMAGPTERELEDRFGLTVRFDGGVPERWRPYYRRMLLAALTDLNRVLPTVDLRGLRIQVGPPSAGEATLALHDSRTRTLHLPTVTGSGTLAHELAHDLDWQVALRRYRVRGDYASDRATRLGGDRLAVWMQELATTIDVAEPRTRLAHAQRPAENFARGVDRFVAASLAAGGRMNGFLSSIQDDVLTGYGTVRPPDISGAAGNALLTILAEVAPVHPDTRAWFLRAYGSRRSVTPQDLVRLVLEAPGAAGGVPGLEGDAHRLEAVAVAEDRLQAVEEARRLGQDAIDGWLCRAPGLAHDLPLEAARRRLVDEAAAARARAVLVELGDEVVGREGRRWMERRLFGGSRDGDVEEAVAELLLPFVERIRAGYVRPTAVPPASGFTMRPPPACVPALVTTPSTR